MENSAEKLEGEPKLSRSLSIHQLYEDKPGISNGISLSENVDSLKHKHKHIVVKDRTNLGQARRQSRKQISFSILQSAIKKRRRDRVLSKQKKDVLNCDAKKKPLYNHIDPNNHPRDSNDSSNSTLGNRTVSSCKDNNDKTAESAENVQHHACLGSHFVIPKRPRGALRRKKSDNSSFPNGTVSGISNSSHKSNTNAQSSMLSGDSVTASPASSINLKKTLTEHKVNSCKTEQGEDVQVTTHEVVTGKATDAKVVRNPRKRRYTSKQNACLDYADLLFHKADESVSGLRVDNLEENAARMLSSRFDPSCTGFSGTRIPPNLANDCSVRSQSFYADSDVLGSKDSSSCDANRTLRPRRRNYNNSAKQRRHFYEVRSANMDPCWVVKRDIRILWPLDQIWYSGIVKAYNSDTGQHHIKYEDRDEEWVDLQKERFKLLMFPSEFSGKLDFSECDNDVKQKKEKAREDERDGSSLNDSETITSWLNRSIRRVNSSPLNISKEKRISHSNKHSTSVLDDVKDSRVSCSSGINTNKTSGSASIVPWGVGGDHNQKAGQEAVDRRFSFVYYRRRFGKRMTRISNSFKDLGNRDSIFSFQSQGALEFDVVSNTLKLNQGKPELILSLPQSQRLIVSHEIFWLLNSYMGFHFGKLMHIWPEIYLDMFFLDNLTGLKIVSCKGCMRNVVAFLCFICRTFQKSNYCRKRTQDRQPFTSIGFKFSGSQDIGRHLFVAHYYYKLGSSGWGSLLKRFKKQCILRREVPASECTCASTKNLLERSDMMPLPEDVESTFLLSFHLKLLMKNEISFYRLMNQNASSLENTQENHGKLSNGNCSLVDDSSCLEDISSPEKSDEGSHTCLDTETCQKQKLAQVEAQLLDTDVRVTGTPDITLDIIKSSSLRSRGEHYRHNPALSSFGYHPQVWPDDFGFVNGYRKPRTQVSYSSPFGGYRSGKLSQGHQKNGPPYKKSRTDNAKKLVAVSRNFQTNLFSLICEANVLIIEGDKGWREHAAVVLLDFDDHDWKILVKLSGITKYSHKAHQFFQPGTTNRYTHAMMWKGGKNWTLEFTNRGQWALFKEMHEECYNRSIRAASVKNIPIPGVRPIEDNNDCCFDSVPFACSFPKYFRQVGTEVDLAMDPSHVIYDMDSDDEEWVLKQRSSLDDDDGSKVTEILDMLFEKVMDMMEKFAYAQQREDFSDAEIESFMEEIGPLETIKSIHKYWLSKRQKKGIPLVRQFQPPLWEQYQKQLKEWELAVSTLSNTCNCQEKISSIEKPPMFAFCLKPRGLEAPNKGSKQRSHKKFTASGQHSMFGREYDNLQPSGRKLSGFLIGDDQHSITVHNHESEDSSLWLQSPTGFSPRASVNTGVASTTNGGLEKIHHIKFQRGNSNNKARVFSSNRDFHVSSTLYNQNHMRIGFPQLNSGSREWSNARQIQPNGFQKHHPDNEEFRLRDASSAAQHATKMAKLKKEKAQWLLHKADLALHRAVVALMSTEAMKASEGDTAEED